MTTGVAPTIGARAQRPRSAPGRPAARHEADAPLRIGVERGMVTTLSVIGPLLLMQTAPALLAVAVPTVVLPVSLALAVLPVLLVPLALLRRGGPGRAWLLLSAVAFFGLAVFLPFEVRSLTTALIPGLVGLSCLAFGCITVGTRHPLQGGVGSAIVITALVAAYAGHLDAGRLVVHALSLVVLATATVAGVTALRRRADSADAAGHAAQRRFDASRRELALADERTRTDALLHDSVLTTLLVAAAGQDQRQRIVLMAHRALEVISDTRGGPAGRTSSRTFASAIAAAEGEFAPMRGSIRLDLDAAHEVELPERVADTLVAAMLQALANSIRHAGPSAARTAEAVPIGDDGVRIRVRDDGCGFDMADIAPERLGVRVSILERVRLVGGLADVHSVPGGGTTVSIEWWPDIRDRAAGSAAVPA